MKVLIIDDELPAREEIARLLGKEADIEILGQCTNAIEGISAINRLNPEVIFLDIQMPRVSGLEMLGMLDPEKMPRVVFLTAFNEYALQAFDQNAFDYLLKPIDPVRLDVTLKRLRRDRTPSPALFNAAEPLKQIPCPGHHRVLLIKIDDIEYATSKTSGVYVTIGNGRTFHGIDATHPGRKNPFVALPPPVSGQSGADQGNQLSRSRHCRNHYPQQPPCAG